MCETFVHPCTKVYVLRSVGQIRMHFELASNTYFWVCTDICVSIFIRLFLFKNAYYVLQIFISLLCLFSNKGAGTIVRVNAMMAYVRAYPGGTAPFSLNFGTRGK